MIGIELRSACIAFSRLCNRWCKATTMDSPGVRTRRQAAQIENQDISSPQPNGHINGSAKPPKQASATKERPPENIFVFIPNIIGQLFQSLLVIYR